MGPLLCTSKLQKSKEVRACGTGSHRPTPETNETRFRTELVFEMGRFRFRDLVNSSEQRAEFLAAILELFTRDEKVNQLVLAVREAYPDYSRKTSKSLSTTTATGCS